MPKNKKNKKYYLIESEKRKWSYGAFPHTDEGLKEAKNRLENQIIKSNLRYELSLMIQRFNQIA